MNVGVIGGRNIQFTVEVEWIRMGIMYDPCHCVTYHSTYGLPEFFD